MRDDAGGLGTTDTTGIDQINLVQVPLVPELRLFLAEDAIVLWARLEAEASRRLPAPYWASAWVGGQALARYVLDRPAVVAGRKVLDLASGSGIVAIAAAMAGASTVIANDIDPYAIAVISANARVNNVTVESLLGDCLDGDGGDADVVLAGDVLYDQSIAARVHPFLDRAAARGAYVLVGDPDRGHLPSGRQHLMASYRVATVGAPEDAQIRQTNVFLMTATA